MKATPVQLPLEWRSANPVLYDKLRQIITVANQFEWIPVRKYGDETKSSNNTHADDGSLFFDAEASKKYAFRLNVFFDTTAAADFKYQIQGPSSPTIIRYLTRDVAPAATAMTVAVQTAFAASVSVLSASTNGGFVEISGILHNGTTAGRVSFQWAQNTSDASNTTVRAGSWLEWMPL